MRGGWRKKCQDRFPGCQLHIEVAGDAISCPGKTGGRTGLAGGEAYGRQGEGEAQGFIRRVE